MNRTLVALFALLTLAGQTFAYVASDPTGNVPQARIVGLGRAYVGLADDTGALYTNPSGVAGVDGWQLSSLSSKFLDEYSYLSFAGLYATDYGVLGVGFSGSSIAGAYPTTIEAGSDPDDPIYTIDPTQPTMGNYNNAFILSYANKFKQVNYLKNAPWAEHLSFGLNAKIFKTALYGDGIVGGDGTGFDMDLGLTLTPPVKWMKYGLVFKNFLPESMGGKLTYASGHTEGYPTVTTLGGCFSLLGGENALRRIGDQELKVLADLELHSTLSNYPSLWHIGLEWKPLPILAIRAGLDQATSGDGSGNLSVVNDAAYGVGLYFGGFRFDYAYHTYAGAPNIDNHLFSLTYMFEPKLVIPESPIVVSVPQDKTITFESSTPVIGTVLDTRIRTLTINTLPLKFTLKGDFSTSADLAIRKNAIALAGNDRDNKQIGALKLRLLRLITFPDVPTSYWEAVPISLLAMTNVITGYPDGTFKPEGNITRAEMCTLLMKAKESGRRVTGAPDNFKDVKGDHWAAPFISRAAAEGVVVGYPDGSFRPKNNITRAEGLAMIARFAEVEKGYYTAEFPDVNYKYWASDIIAGAYKAGILKFLEGKNFEPKKPLTRAEAVEMIYRTKFMQDLLGKDLLNWETY